MPIWLSPVQLVIASITEEAIDYAKKLYNECIENNIRVNLDIRNEKISYKIREHSNDKIPVIFIIGKNEIKENKVSVRRLGSSNQDILNFNEALKKIINESKLP